jgi:DNA-binding MarR family transcriptional regulator
MGGSLAKQLISLHDMCHSAAIDDRDVRRSPRSTRSKVRQVTVEPPVTPQTGAIRELTDADYQALASFRAELRHFLHHSERAARAVGLTPQQHQLLLAVRGHAGELPPFIGELAEALQVRHHTAVEQIDRLERMGLVERTTSGAGRRRVHVTLTNQGKSVLRQLTEVNWLEYRSLHAFIDRLLDQLNTGP